MEDPSFPVKFSARDVSSESKAALMGCQLWGAGGTEDGATRHAVGSPFLKTAGLSTAKDSRHFKNAAPREPSSRLKRT